MIASVVGDPLLAAFLTFTLVFVATPGATTAVIVRNALDGGRRAGLYAAVGAAAANLTHATLARLGGAALLTAWPGGLNAIRVAGGGYLAFLGVRGLWTLYTQWSAPVVPARTGSLGSPHHSLREGFAVNMLSPVILTFYLAVVPTFIRPVWPRSAYWLLAAAHVTTAFACHSAWVLALHRMRTIFERHGPRRVLGLAASLAMLVLAGRVLLR